MRVLICPDKFAGTISAVDAAAALADGWRAAAPDDETVLRPLADGGTGFLDVLAAALPGARRLPVPTVDPLGRPVGGVVLLAGGSASTRSEPVSPAVVSPAVVSPAVVSPAVASPVVASGEVVAYLESAQACGLHLLAESERDPRITTSYGLGLLVTAAVEAGAREVVVGLGGSAVNDAGAGMLTALGAAPLDAAGYALPYGGAALVACASLGDRPRLRDARLVAATDVDNPLLGPHGASQMFGPQKGATGTDALLLDAALERFATVLDRDLPGCPSGLAALPGAGAAGGLGAALLALGGRSESGIGLVRHLTGLDAALDRADLVITGEGSFDQQSLRGKVVSGVAAAARARGVPCLVVAGRVSVDRGQAEAAGVAEAYSLVEHFGGPEAGGVEKAMTRTAEGLRAVAVDLARR